MREKEKSLKKKVQKRGGKIGRGKGLLPLIIITLKNDGIS